MTTGTVPARLRVHEDHADPTRVVIGVDDLRDLMESVDETTRTLQETHVALQRQVVELQGELAEANAQLRRSRSLAALGEMAAGIAHEIRNPLGSIQLYSQLLGEDLADRPETAELCDKISRAVSGLDAIVRDVLLFARETTVTAVDVTARELVDRALEGCDALLADGAIGVAIDVDPALRLQADPGLMTSALGNVIRNAIEAMRESDAAAPELAVTAGCGRTRCPDGHRAEGVHVAVRDTGPGIPAAVVDRIFNPFFTTRASGTGLGLAIVHRIVDAHDGHLKVDSEPGRGTTVTLFIPTNPDIQAISERSR